MDDHLVRASELSGRAVVNIDTAEKVGRVDRVVLDPDARRVAGFLVSRGSGADGNAMHMAVPAAAVHAVGPDAVTMHNRGGVPGTTVDHLHELPAASELIGRKVVTADGRFLGRIAEVLVDRRDGAIVAYPIGDDDVLGKIESLFRGRKRMTYLRADADLRSGDDLVVAPADAVMHDESWGRAGHTEDDGVRDDQDRGYGTRREPPPVTSAATTAPWRECPPPAAGSNWIRRETTRQ
jgi:sporulation protein YlmC with PRC-barrel domain